MQTSQPRQQQPPMDEMPYQLSSWLDGFNTMMEGLYQQGYQLTPETARQGLANLTSTFVTPGPELAGVYDAELDSGSVKIPLRLYCPKENKPLPLLIYLHGGGHMAGSIEVYDPICRRLAATTNHAVLSVEYRLAPEHAFPAGIDDAEHVLRHHKQVFKDLGLPLPLSVSLGGDSAGGAMATTLANRFQSDGEIKLENLVLIYPSLDYTLGSSSVANLAQGFFLEQDKIEWYFVNYFQNGENYRQVSPLYMEYQQNFPRTMVITAGFCPLCDEAREFVALLQGKEIEVCHKHFPTMVHAYLNLEQLVESECQKTYEAIADFLKAGNNL